MPASDVREVAANLPTAPAARSVADQPLEEIETKEFEP